MQVGYGFMKIRDVSTRGALLVRGSTGIVVGLCMMSRPRHQHWDVVATLVKLTPTMSLHG